MKQIDRLLVKASGGYKKWSMLAFVDYLGHCWETRYSFWDGKLGSGGQYAGSSRHSTCDEALAAIKQAGKDFPYLLADTDVYVDDFGTETGGACVGTTP